MKPKEAYSFFFSSSNLRKIYNMIAANKAFIHVVTMKYLGAPVENQNLANNLYHTVRNLIGPTSSVSYLKHKKKYDYLLFSVDVKLCIVLKEKLGLRMFLHKVLTGIFRIVKRK
jgi:hypothetical protein